MTCWKRQREPGPVQSGEHHTQLTHTMGSSPSHPWLCFLSSHFPPNLPAPWMWVSLQSCFLAVAPLPTCSSSPPPAGGGHAQWRLLGSYSQQGYHRAAWPHESWLIPPLGPAGQNRAGSLSVRINQTGTRRLTVLRVGETQGPGSVICPRKDLTHRGVQLFSVWTDPSLGSRTELTEGERCPLLQESFRAHRK